MRHASLWMQATDAWRVAVPGGSAIASLSLQSEGLDPSRPTYHAHVLRDGTGAVDEDGLLLPRWVVFSAHDETDDDLRRRWNDPDLSLVDGRHPVVFAGAGSHSGAYLPGDCLITIPPPSFGGPLPVIRRAGKALTPWTRAAQGSGLGIPYIDYARGVGLSIGPGQDVEWTPNVIEDNTPWVRDYRSRVSCSWSTSGMRDADDP